MNNKRESLAKKEILVDTSFLLPALGFDVEKEVYQAIKKFTEFKVHYLEVSILEAMWSILKKVKYEKRDFVYAGLESIRNTYEKMEIKPDYLIRAWEVYLNAHRDFIDNILYSASLIEKMPLLTIDRKLKDNLEKKGYPTKYIIFPNDLM